MKVEKECPICGKKYMAYINRLEIGRETTCSRECSYIYRGNKHKGICVKDLTGKIFGRLTVLIITDVRGGNGSARWVCRCSCGRKVTVSAKELLGGSTRSCGCIRRRNGGIQKHGDGYLRELAPGHPRANARGYVYQHRLVMERILGRSLILGEVVHHEDGNRANNDPSNLRLFPSDNAHQDYHRRQRAALNTEASP